VVVTNNFSRVVVVTTADDATLCYWFPVHGGARDLTTTIPTVAVVVVKASVDVARER